MNDYIDWKAKLSSRKFWICCAAFLGSIGASIAGIQSGNQFIAAFGLVCSTLSAAIYAAAEAAVDKAREVAPLTVNHYGAINAGGTEQDTEQQEGEQE